MSPLLFRLKSAYCDEGTLDSLEVKIGVLGSVPTVHHPSSHLLRWVALLSLFRVLYRYAGKLFLLFFLVDIRVHRMTMLSLGFFVDGGHLTAIHASHFFLMMLDLEVGGGGDEFIVELFGGVIAHLSIVPYYELADGTLQKG